MVCFPFEQLSLLHNCFPWIRYGCRYEFGEFCSTHLKVLSQTPEQLTEVFLSFQCVVRVCPRHAPSDLRDLIQQNCREATSPRLEHGITEDTKTSINNAQTVSIEFLEFSYHTQAVKRYLDFLTDPSSTILIDQDAMRWLHQNKNKFSTNNAFN